MLHENKEAKFTVTVAPTVSCLIRRKSVNFSILNFLHAYTHTCSYSYMRKCRNSKNKNDFSRVEILDPR